jgi:uncharacterized protein (DUF1778 family)
VDLVLYSDTLYNVLKMDRVLFASPLDVSEVARREAGGHVKDQKRLDLRVSSAEKETIARAAALSGRTLSEFVRGTMLAAANREIREHEVIRLTNEGSRAFVAALMEPPEPNGNLLRLARESRFARLPKDGGQTGKDPAVETSAS